MSKPTQLRPALPAATPLPKSLSDLLQAGRIRSLDDVTDVTALMIKAFAEGDIHPARSKEIRQWTELLYTAVSAKSPAAETQVNLITQLIALDQPVSHQRTTIIDATGHEPKAQSQLHDSGPRSPLDFGRDELIEVSAVSEHVTEDKSPVIDID